MNESAEPTNFNSSEPTLREEPRLDEIYSLVSAEFQILDYYMENGILTFHVQTDKNSKEAFLRLYRNLKPMRLLPILRREGEKIILKIVGEPPAKKSNLAVNLLLFFATLATTFITGYLISGGRGGLDPLFGGLTFMITVMAILGIHETGHKIMANKHGIEATSPYFIPGPPPPFGIGTFGAVIMQRSPPPNSDALFDVGAAGPIAGFIISLIATIIGLPLSQIHFSTELLPGLPPPILFEIIVPHLVNIPEAPPGHFTYILLHPIAYAGWIGMVVTMLNLLPVGTLDGGHIVESIFKGKARSIFLIASIALLFFTEFWAMIFFVLLFGLYRHPGPLDSVSGLSTGRKLLAIGMLLIFILSFPMPVFLS